MELRRLVYYYRLLKSRIFLLFLFITVGYSAVQSQKLPEFKSAIRLSEFINSSSEELRPILSFDGNEMYFTRAYHPANIDFLKIKQNKDIWYSKKRENGQWSTAINIEALNDASDNTAVAITKERDLYITSFDKKRKDLQYSIGKVSKTAEGWSEPDIVHIPTMNFSGDFTDFFISKEEDLILLSIVSEKGYGKEDLYVSFNKDGTWTEPKNLGTYINTTEHEFAPFVSDDKRFLYFTSTGRGGLGGGDVFVSTRLDNSWQYWSEPVNLGEIVNSNAMDCYFTIANDNYYISSNREEETGMDIYQLTDEIVEQTQKKNLIAVKGYISDSITNEFLTSEIKITDLDENETIEILSNRNGFYTINLEKGKSYQFNILRAPYHEMNKEITLPTEEDNIETFWQHFLLSKYERGDKIELENLHFHTSTANLRDESIPILEKLIKIMGSNKNMKIRIEGHTDNSGSKIALYKLSLQRAKEIRDKLISAGISKRRIKTRGYGGFKPLVPNTSEPNKRKNRRVEFVIL